MNALNYRVPDGGTTLEIREVGDVTYRICARIGASKAKDVLSVQKIEVSGGVTTIKYTSCLYADIETATYKGLED